MPEIRTGVEFLQFFSTTRGLNMRSFLSVVVKLYSYKDSDVENLCKFEYFYDSI